MVGPEEQADKILATHTVDKLYTKIKATRKTSKKGKVRNSNRMLVGFSYYPEVVRFMLDPTLGSRWRQMFSHKRTIWKSSCQNILAGHTNGHSSQYPPLPFGDGEK